MVKLPRLLLERGHTKNYNFPILIFKFLKLRLCIDLKIFIKTYFNCQGDVLNNNYENLLYNVNEPIVCEACLKEYKNLDNPDIALRDYVKVDVGFTRIGIQVWCQRHEKNICHIDFGGNRPPADFRCLEKS